MNSGDSPGASQKARFAFPNQRIDLRWVIDELVVDGLLSDDDATLIRMSRRDKVQASRHPLEMVAFSEPDHQLEPGKTLTLDVLSQWLADKAGVPLFHIDPLQINVSSVTAVMSYEFAERHGILAVDVKPEEVVIATSQPFYMDWEHGLAQTLKGRTIRRVVANPVELQRFTVEFYNLSKSMAGATGSVSSGSDITNFEQLLELGSSSLEANDQHIVNIVDWLLQYAFDQRASDIHLEPRREVGRVRFRIDGVLHDVYEMPAPVLAAVTSRIKILGRLDVAEKRRPQDGRLKTKSPEGNEVELRLSTLPTAFGEKLVMRIFDPDVLVRTYAQLGLTNEDYKQWQHMVGSHHGIVFVTGPTGSGKTTTLYSTLKQLATRDVNVCTIEDPIEMVEDSFNQMQVQDNIDLSIADGVKALLRQDPDIIMIGEIRDLDTANMAIQAALTGHLVISTLHTNDAPSAITRLVDLGVPPYLIGATVIGIMAQRLVRTLCPHCKREIGLDEKAWQALVQPWKSKCPAHTFEPVGCLECRDTGYMGRMGVYEMMVLSNDMKGMVSEGAPLAEIRKQAYQEGMRTLRLSGAQKVANGLTTIEEVMRVTPTPSSI